MKRILSLLLAVCLMLSCAALFGGCKPEKETNDFPVTFGDVTIEQEPKAIVVLSDKLADIISYIGYDVKMVGRSEECTQEFLQVVPAVGKASAPDIAAITAAGADLVIADNTLPEDVKQNLTAAGLKVIVMNIALNTNELGELYENVGTVLGGKETGRAKGEKGFSTLFETLDTLNTASTKVLKTSAYLYLDQSGQLCTFVKDSLEQKFFSYNGAPNVLADQTEPLANLDSLRIESPSFIFCDSIDVINVLQNTPGLANIKAIAEGHTLVIPKVNFERHGTSVEQAVFDMLSYIEKVTKTTPDQATPDQPTAAPTQAATVAAAQPASDAPTEAQADEEYYEDQDVYTDEEVYY